MTNTFPRLARTLFAGLWVFLGAAALLPTNAHATRWANQFVEFELPLKWQCSLEGYEFVCQSTDEKKRRDAIIVLAAKKKGDQDTLEKYDQYLKRPRTFTSPTGKPTTSEPKYVRNSTLNGHIWVDSLHLDSEIPGFYTRYLATVKEDLGVLVTYSINKTKYQEYVSQFEEMVKSLKVFRKPGGMLAESNANLFRPMTNPGNYTATVFPDQTPAQAAAPADASDRKQKKAASDDEDLMLYLGGFALAVVAFIYIRKRRGRIG